MAKGERHRCSGRLKPPSWATFRDLQCTADSKVERDGKWYCGTHDPVAVKAKRDARSADRSAQRNAEQAIRVRADAERAEQKRRADLFPVLLDALKAFVALYDGDDPGTLVYRDQFEPARAAIAKAEDNLLALTMESEHGEG